MIYEGRNLTCKLAEDGFAELCFDARDGEINKLDLATLKELAAAVAAVSDSGAKGLMLTSNKDSFIVGADITEFLENFGMPEEQLLQGLEQSHAIFNALEDLPMPTVAAIQGYALGGGLELCLACDYRIGTPNARIGVPEVKLGIFPGLGGTIRLPRLIGADNAIEWIAGGGEYKAEAARAVGGLDGVVAPENLRRAALAMLTGAVKGDFDYRAARDSRKGPLLLNRIEAGMVFEGGKAFVSAKAGPHYPAPVAAISVMQKSAGMRRDEALAVERKAFIKVARTEVAANLVGIFLSDQFLKKQAKRHQKIAGEVNAAAVLGAGIMGGGIAYQTASRAKIPVLMKDIRPDALQLGLDEATRLLGKLVQRGKIGNEQVAGALNLIRPTMSYAEMDSVDIVVEAVVENAKIKAQVLAELEEHVTSNTVIASNTSTISISSLAKALKHPQRFVGMHFFNPVHKMPLVEVIRGEASSDEAIATTVAFAQKLGKNPIVVNDCPGFLVNRILFPYLAGFNLLIGRGADHMVVDKVLEGFGWPMGPAYLNDVVGMDTAHHAGQVMAAGFPDRLSDHGKTIVDLMYERKRFGQKNGLGFYAYQPDKKGRIKKAVDPVTHEMIRELAGDIREIPSEEIIDYMMIPMVLEAARCLEDGIVGTPQEVDMGLVYGIGFPAFRGGALKYADTLGLDKLCARAERYAHHGNLFKPTDTMKQMAQDGKTYYRN